MTQSKVMSQLMGDCRGHNSNDRLMIRVDTARIFVTANGSLHCLPHNPFLEFYCPVNNPIQTFCKTKVTAVKNKANFE